MLRLRKLSSTRGDTIVEVLIAISVISAVLAGAYVSANHSSKAVRTAQERSEALKLAESQVEQIKITRDKSKSLPISPNTFCFDTANVIHTNPDPVCTVTPIQYRLDIAQQAPPNNTTYVVKVSWDNLGGGTNNLELDYKIQ